MKNNPIRPLLLAAMTGALTAGVTTTILMSDRAPAVTPSTSSLMPEPGGNVEIEELRAENADLRGRMAALELRPAGVERTAVGEWVTRADFEGLREELRALLVAQGIDLEEGGGLRTRVADAMDAVREEEAQARTLRSLEKETARREKRVTAMTDWLGLNDYQAQEMRAVYAQVDERNRELKRQWQETGDNQAAGDQKRTNAELYRSELERVLTPGQLEVVDSSKADSGKD